MFCFTNKVLISLTSLTARPCGPSWASTPPGLMMTGHPGLALTALGTGSTVGPRETRWKSTNTCRHAEVSLMCKVSLLPISSSSNFLCRIHTHVCHTWLLSSLAHTHSSLSHGDNPNCGRSHTSAHSLLQRIP